MRTTNKPTFAPPCVLKEVLIKGVNLSLGKCKPLCLYHQDTTIWSLNHQPLVPAFIFRFDVRKSID